VATAATASSTVERTCTRFVLRSLASIPALRARAAADTRSESEHGDRSRESGKHAHCWSILARYVRAVKPRGSCEHTFVTSRGHPYAEFQRALKNGNVWVAEAVARELQHVWLEDALRLTYLHGEKEQWEKFEPAALKWLRRYLDEKEPTLKNFAEVVRSLEERET
jgi:hypothetical protein